MNSLNDYMKFRLGAHSEEPEEKKPEGTAEEAKGTEEKKETEEKATEEASGEQSKEGELETHSVMGSLFESVVKGMLAKADETDAKSIEVLVLVYALICTVAEMFDIPECRAELAELRSKIADLKEGKEVADFSLSICKDKMAEFAAKVQVAIDAAELDDEKVEAIKAAIKLTQEEAKKSGIQTEVASYSKMAVYSESDVLKAHLYLKDLGWEKVSSDSYLVPGTDQVLTVTNKDDESFKVDVNGSSESSSKIQFSFEAFKDFIDNLINNRVGSYSDEDEMKDAIKISEDVKEKSYTEDEITEQAEELKQEVEAELAANSMSISINGDKIYAYSCEGNCEEIINEDGELDTVVPLNSYSGRNLFQKMGDKFKGRDAKTMEGLAHLGISRNKAKVLEKVASGKSKKLGKKMARVGVKALVAAGFGKKYLQDLYRKLGGLKGIQEKKEELDSVIGQVKGNDPEEIKSASDKLIRIANNEGAMDKVAEVKEEYQGKLAAASSLYEGGVKVAFYSEGTEEPKVCPECGKDPCECEKKPEGEVEANCGDFETKLNEELSKEE